MKTKRRREIRAAAEMEPCPFCGAWASIARDDEGWFDGMYSVNCDGCTAQVRARTEADVIAAWNRRMG